MGLLPYRILELYQRLVTNWRRWHAEADPKRRAWIEARIIDDAGVLGHYVTDGSQPHHTTIHFNGWDADTPNPEGFTEDRTFHSRFERFFVDAHITQPDVDRRLPSQPRSVAGGAKTAVLDFLGSSHAQVPELYRLDRDVGFDPDEALRTPTRDFAADRLAAGSKMLADLWWSAWIEGSG